MKIFIYLEIILLLLLTSKLNRVNAQATENDASEIRQENIMERDEQQETNDMTGEDYKNLEEHPIDLNTADADDLKMLAILSPFHIEHLISYRKLLGRLISIYELQSIPYWNIEIIKRILPYIKVGEDGDIVKNLKARIASGHSSLQIRSSEVVERADGYLAGNDSVSHYYGSPVKLLLKYKYAYKNLLQYGVTAEKDAGEQFFKGNQKTGFDFYSAHFFLRKLGSIKALAVGDFTVSMGQGLILWQTMGMGKSADVLAVKRQAPVLKPYQSAGEYNFQRGAGITFQQGAWEGTVFASKRRLDAVTGERGITSIGTAGYHRTASEFGHKNSAGLATAGMNLKYNGSGWYSSVNLVNYTYSLPVRKGGEPYNYFAMRGRSFAYGGVDYGYTLRNAHFFGELAWLDWKHLALLNGLLISIDKQVDASVILRRISSQYISLYGNAFTEGTLPVNEQGIYTGITFRPSAALSFSAYCDLFRFPWLKYRVDATSYGNEYLLICTYQPDKKTELYIRFRRRTKGINEPGSSLPMEQLMQESHQNLRIHSNIILSSSLTFRNRVEIVWFNLHKATAERGFLWYAELLCKPMMSSWSGNIRLASFDTDGYSSRVYSYEQDMLYNSSVMPYFNRGVKYLVNIRKKIIYQNSGNKWTLNLMLKWSQVINNQYFMSSGLDNIPGKKKSEVKVGLTII